MSVCVLETLLTIHLKDFVNEKIQKKKKKLFKEGEHAEKEKVIIKRRWPSEIKLLSRGDML